MASAHELTHALLQILHGAAYPVMSLLYLTSKGIIFNESNFAQGLDFLVGNGCLVNKILPDTWSSDLYHWWMKMDIANAPRDLFLLDQRPFAPLHFAADRMPAFVIDALIRHGADINQNSAYSLKPIHRAAMSRNASALKALLRHGADPNTRDPFRSMPLIMACTIDDDGQNNVDVMNQCVFKVNCCLMSECVDILLDNGADATLVATWNFSPLHFAVKHRADGFGVMDTIQLLLQHNASPNTVLVSNRRTPLHMAILKDNFPAAIMMIADYNANILLVEKGIKATALHLALMKYIFLVDDGAPVELIQVCMSRVGENDSAWRAKDKNGITSDNILDYICVHHAHTYARIMNAGICQGRYSGKDSSNAAVQASARKVRKYDYSS